MPSNHPNEHTTIVFHPASWKVRAYNAGEEDRARQLIRNEVLLKRAEPYYEVRAKIKRAGSGEPQRIILYMLRANSYTADVVEIRTDGSYGASTIREGADVVDPDDDSDIQQYSDQVLGTYANIDVVVATPVPNIPTAKQAVDTIASLFEGAGFRVLKLIGTEASVSAYRNALLSQVKAFFNVGHGYTGGIVLSDGNLTSTWFASLANRPLSPAVVYFNSCQVFNPPLQPVVMTAGTRTFVGGKVNLLIGPSERTAISFWQRVLVQLQAIGAALTASEAENYPVPGAHGVSGDLGVLDAAAVGAIFYEHANFQGRCRSLSVGRYNLADIGLPNDCISSVRVSSGMQVTLYQDAGFVGNSITLTGTTSYVGTFNDKTSSIVIEPLSTAPAVDIYEHANFGGMRKRLGIGRYNINQIGLPNDCISSVRVGPNLKVTLYEHANFTGSQVSYVHDSNFVGTFNDKASSIVVERITTNVVEVFEDVNFGGRCASLGVGDYNLNQIGLPNDSLSSARIPRGFELTVYEHANFGGASIRYRRSTSNVGAFNDKTSSIRVRKVS